MASIKSLLVVINLSLLVASCSVSATQSIMLPEAVKTGINEPTRLISTTPVDTITPSSTSSMTASAISTQTATITITPSITLTPTEDQSFYAAAACIPQNTSYQKGTVTQVMDGDTVSVLLDDGNTYSVRYIGIDAPESEERYFAESFDANSNLVLQKEVILIKDISERDQYDRLLRYVIVEDVFVNLELVKIGLAKAVSYPPDLSCADSLLSAEEEARGAQVGMWIATPTPEASPPNVVILAVNKREEWVDIQNLGDADVDLAGWNLVSERGHQECYLSGVIKSGEVLRIWSGTAQGNGFSCGYNNPIWNNSEPDPAVLYNAQGVEVSRK